MDSTLDFDKLRTISATIKKLTHSGCNKIKVSQLNEIVNICNINKEYIKHAFSKIMLMLRENHSEVRLGAVILSDHFFNAFSEFRSLLIENFDKYFKYTLGEKFNQDLPPPKPAAKSLVKLSISNFNKWASTFSRDYPVLHSTYCTLRNEKCVDFEKLVIYDPVKRAIEEKAASESLAINKALLEKVTDEIKEINGELNECLTSLQTCFNLLIDFPDESETCDVNTSSSLQDDLRLHGVIQPHHNIEINISSSDIYRIKINDENSSIIDNVRDLISLIQKKYLPKVKAWTVLISKVGGYQQLSNEALVTKSKLENAVIKYNRLKFIESISKDEDCVSTDSELEEVEDEVATKEKIKISQEKNLFNEKISNKPCSSKSDKLFSERKRDLLKVAPKMPYNTDLYHWEDKRVAMETLLPTASDGHRFWASSSLDSIEVPAESSSLRVIEFSGKFEPVTRACNAPLSSGKLCSRYDRIKCPFHGLIVPRDESGKIINEEDEAKVKKSKTEDLIPDWQDPKLLAELKESTGLDLKVGKKKRKIKHPGLTDIKKKESSYDRIEKKIFKSSTLKRTNKYLDKLDYKRHRDKFGDQFNYLTT